jgi:predicted nucleic acid-binding protein
LNTAVDSSFVVSLYARDANSTEAARRMGLNHDLWITSLNRAELAHAIHQLIFRKQFSPSDAARAWDEFEQDCIAGVWIPADLPERLWEKSISLARRFGPTLGVRTLDSLHVACALELKAEKFWTFDERQARLAEAAGLDTTA